MIHVALPLGAMHGWGIVGRSVTKELAGLTKVRLITDPFDANTVGDVFDHVLLASLVPPGTTPQTGVSVAARVDGPVLQCMLGVEHDAFRPALRGTFNLGYTFFEDNLLVSAHLGNARRDFDAIATGATWCRDVLKAAGYENASVILQGVDPRLFNPHLNEKEFFKDKFVVFSGGKMEFRKGQDIAIRAYAVLAQRHRDVMLVNQWYNLWPASLQTMAASPLIRFQIKTTEYLSFVQQLLSDNGIDPARVMTLGPMANTAVNRVYKNTDVGLFPNRCEGGTNLVMNEYMACGKPVVASFNTGHRDVLTEQNSIRIMTNRPFTYHRGGTPVGTWEEPDLEETIERLEWAYQHRGELGRIADQAAADMQRLTWRRTAEEFLDALDPAGNLPRFTD